MYRTVRIRAGTMQAIAPWYSAACFRAYLRIFLHALRQENTEMENMLKQWLAENHREPLTAEQERRLVLKVQAKDRLFSKLGQEKREPDRSEKRIISEGRLALQTLVEHMIPLGISFAKKYADRYPSSSLTFEDFEQEAFLGVMHAASVFEPERGTRFYSYAVFWIEQYIRRAIEDKGDIIRRPASAHSRMRKIRNFGAGTAAEEISKKTGISKSEVEFLRMIDSIQVISLEGGTREEDESTGRHEEIADPSDFRTMVEDNVMRDQIRAIIRSMKSSEKRMVMEMHLGLTKNRVFFTNRQISDALGMKMADVNTTIRQTVNELVMWNRYPYMQMAS